MVAPEPLAERPQLPRGQSQAPSVRTHLCLALRSCHARAVLLQLALLPGVPGLFALQLLELLLAVAQLGPHLLCLLLQLADLLAVLLVQGLRVLACKAAPPQ